MRRFALITSTLLSLLFAICATAQIRGTGRLQGNVHDKNTGKAVAGATVTISIPGSALPIVSHSDAKGHWAAIGMTSGSWNIDISAPGYVTSRGTANVSEVQTAPPINVNLEPQEAPQPAAEPSIAPAASTVPREAIDAIKEGQDLLKTTAGDMVTNSQTTTTGGSTAVSHTVTAAEVKDNAKRAVADFEKALPLIPEDRPELRDVKNQVLAVLAQAYYRSGDVKDAIATLEKLDATDPAGATPDATHTTRDILLANLYLENNQLDQGRALLEKLPANAISDPTAYINIGILFMNKQNPKDAIGYFTKAINLNAKAPEGYYYRGLAEVQVKNYSAARSDLQQFLTLAPNAPEAQEAKQLLSSMK